MANHKSSEKRARQSVRKQKVNNSRKNSLKTFEKALLKAVADKDAKAALSLMKDFMSQVGKAAKTGVLKKETASRKVSRISKRVSSAFPSANK